MTGVAIGLVATGAAIALAVSMSLPAAVLLMSLLAAAFAAALVGSTGRATPAFSTGDAGQRERARLALQAMLDQSPTPMLLADGAALTALNRSARLLFGVDDRIPNPTPALLAAVDGGTVSLPADSGMRTFAAAQSEIDGFGHIINLIDISADLRIAEATASRELMLVLSHEIMNGMTPIASMAQTAVELMADGGEPALRETIATIARRAEGLAAFSAAYRELAKLPPPERREVDVRELTVDLARLFAARWPTTQIQLIVGVVPPDLCVRVDGGQLASALWALLQNAGEACVDQPPAARVRLEVRGDGGTVSFQVGDTGPGVDPLLGDRIFQPFFTTRATGSGIGLALARQIFRAHGGDLVLLAQHDGGAEFVGTVPV